MLSCGKPATSRVKHGQLGVGLAPAADKRGDKAPSVRAPFRLDFYDSFRFGRKEGLLLELLPNRDVCGRASSRKRGNVASKSIVRPR